MASMPFNSVWTIMLNGEKRSSYTCSSHTQLDASGEGSSNGKGNAEHSCTFSRRAMPHAPTQPPTAGLIIYTRLELAAALLCRASAALAALIRS